MSTKPSWLSMRIYPVTVTGRRAEVIKKIRQIAVLLLTIAELAALPVVLKAQSLAKANSGDSSGTVASRLPAQLAPAYSRPTEKMKLGSYFFDAFGPYPLIAAGLAAGINQVYDTAPEWKQGSVGYGKRFGSSFGTLAVTTTTRYALAEAFKEDTLYYRCECKGPFPRLSHAVISTFTARRGEDGHRVFSFPALVAPYVGTMTAVYAWYPSRYDARDALRMGNYSVLGYMAVNIGREFIHSGPGSLGSRMHLNNAHRAANPGSSP